MRRTDQIEAMVQGCVRLDTPQQQRFVEALLAAVAAIRPSGVPGVAPAAAANAATGHAAGPEQLLDVLIGWVWLWM
jgi:hypothetical protein